MNDVQVFRRRRVERIVEEEVRHGHRNAEEAAQAALARIKADSMLMEVAAEAGLKALIVEKLRAKGAVEVAPGVWDVPSRPDGAA